MNEILLVYRKDLEMVVNKFKKIYEMYELGAYDSVYEIAFDISQPISELVELIKRED